MGSKSWMKEDGRIRIKIDYDWVLFNIGKQIFSNQSKLTRWKKNFKKKGKVVRKEEGLIEIELTKEINQGSELEDFEIILNEYPFLYYRFIKNSILDEEGIEVISIIKDIDTLRELIMKDITMKEEMWLEETVISYMNRPLNTKVVYEYEEGFIDYYTISSWLSFCWKKELKVLPTLVFDLYEIEIDGFKTNYTESTGTAEVLISLETDKAKKVKVFRNGKEVEQGVRLIDLETKEKWIHKGEEFDPRREVYKSFKLIERKQKS